MYSCIYTGRGTSLTGQPYGHLFEPEMIGSSGGGDKGTYVGARGGGTVWMNITGILHNDGHIQVNGANATNDRAGGGSGGSLWVHCNKIRGTGQ